MNPIARPLNKLITIFGLFFLLTACSSTPKENPKPPEYKTIVLSRYLAIKTCSTKGKCTGPSIKGLDKADLKFTMKPISDGNEKGLTASDVFSITEEGISFNSEIRVTKKDDSPEYEVYMMLKSGPAEEPEKKIRTFRLKDLAYLPETRITDSPIKYKNGTLQAELVLGPPHNSQH